MKKQIVEEGKRDAKKKDDVGDEFVATAKQVIRESIVTQHDEKRWESSTS